MKENFNYVIVYKLDRFSKIRYDSAVNKSILKKNCIKAISSYEYISDIPKGILFESMIEGYADTMNDIEQGVVTATTNSRILDLKQQKSDLETKSPLKKRTKRYLCR